MSAEETSKGLVVLVGGGPGDPSLITVGGVEWLTRADVVVYDNLVSPDLLGHCRDDAELIYVGKRSGQHSASQDEINRILVDKCSQGRLVVRLKGGDPFVFGRGGEEVEALQEAGLAFRVVPGVTAGIAAGAYAGIPVTDRRKASVVAFVTGHEDPYKGTSSLNWESLAWLDTVVFYMGVGNLRSIADQMMMVGRYGETPAAVIERATTPRQRTVIGTLETISDMADSSGIRPPAIIIVGDVAGMGERLDWFEQLPLFGRTVLVTRSRKQASRLSARLAEMGAEVIEAPTIDILPPESFEPMDQAIRRLEKFAWAAFTSPNGAEGFFRRLDLLGLDVRALGGVKVAAVGEATAEALRERGVRADLVPPAFTTEALGQALIGALESRKARVLLARSDLADPALTEALRQAGAKVEEVVAYRTARPAGLGEEALAALRRRGVDWITFTSSSTVENFLALAEDDQIDLSAVKPASIGPVTSRALRRHGLEPAAEAQPYTIDALADAIILAERNGE